MGICRGIGCARTFSALVVAAVVTSTAKAAVMPGLLHQPLRLNDGTVYLGPGSDDLRSLLAPHNLNAADTTNADQLRPGELLGLNLSGAGVTIGVWDNGAVRASHEQLAGRV